MAVLGLHFRVHAFSSCGEWGLVCSCSSWAADWCLLLRRSMGSRHAGFIVVVHRLIAQQHVRSSHTRDQTRVLCVGRQILYHRTTSEVLILLILFSSKPQTAAIISRRLGQFSHWMNTLETRSGLFSSHLCCCCCC